MRVFRIMDYNNFFLFIALTLQVWTSRNNHYFGSISELGGGCFMWVSEANQKVSSNTRNGDTRLVWKPPYRGKYILMLMQL